MFLSVARTASAGALVSTSRCGGRFGFGAEGRDVGLGAPTMWGWSAVARRSEAGGRALAGRVLVASRVDASAPADDAERSERRHQFDVIGAERSLLDRQCASQATARPIGRSPRRASMAPRLLSVTAVSWSSGPSVASKVAKCGRRGGRPPRHGDPWRRGSRPERPGRRPHRGDRCRGCSRIATARRAGASSVGGTAGRVAQAADVVQYGCDPG